MIERRVSEDTFSEENENNAAIRITLIYKLFKGKLIRSYYLFTS